MQLTGTGQVGGGTRPTFRWTTFDLAGQLPGDWRSAIAATAATALFDSYPRTPILSREARDVAHIYRGRVRADEVRKRLPWLYQLYRGGFLELANEACAEDVTPASDDRYGLVLNVQRGTDMRFECHVDSNPLTGLLFCTEQPAGAGGELVFGRNPSAPDLAAIDQDCSIIRPQLSYLIFFDGRYHPHYARALTAATDMRVVAVMNYYTKSYPESTRPEELNRHLFGGS